MLPNDFPKWQLVYYYFYLWKNTGVYDEILATLNKEVRKSNRRHNSPSPGVIDSKSMRAYHHCDKEKGIDGNKKIKGIKLQIIVDCLELILAVYGHAANIHDSKAAYETVRRLDDNKKQILYDLTARYDFFNPKARESSKPYDMGSTPTSFSTDFKPSHSARKASTPPS